MTHKHTWRPDPTRTHKRPPRFFAVCECGARSQAIMRGRYIHVFNTHKVSVPELVKRPYSIRLSRADIQALHSGKLEIVFIDKSLRLQVKS